MLWLLFALLTAFFESLKDVFSKKGVVHVDEYLVAWSWRVFALPFLLPVLFFVSVPAVGSEFWKALIISGGINMLATILYVKALKHSDISNTVPLLTFTPAFVLLTGPLVVGEFPSTVGIAGIMLIIIGSYILKLKERHKGHLGPFKALLKEKGSRYMLAVAFIWSISSVYDKVGVQNSSPFFWALSLNVFITAAMLPILLITSRKHMLHLPAHSKQLLPIGLCSALMLFTQMTAISMALVAYVISVKRTSTVMSVLWGYALFKEQGLKERLLGTMLMVLGVVVIAAG